MAVAAVSAVNNSTLISKTSELDKNAFLRLFTTQLKNQDPLNPMDSADFTAQLAQFSSLEQLFQVNTQLTQLLDSQKTLMQEMTAGLIGKTVTLEDGSSGQVIGVVFGDSGVQLVLKGNKTVSLDSVKKISA